jgi:hypothetical protein
MRPDIWGFGCIMFEMMREIPFSSVPLRPRLGSCEHWTIDRRCNRSNSHLVESFSRLVAFVLANETAEAGGKPVHTPLATRVSLFGTPNRAHLSVEPSWTDVYQCSWPPCIFRNIHLYYELCLVRLPEIDGNPSLLDRNYNEVSICSTRS